MNPDEFDTLMRSREAYHGLTVPEDKWIVLRVDGRGFSKLTLDMEFRKPFDLRFRELMLTTTTTLLDDMAGVYAFVESDEISVLLPQDTDLFKRSVEKLVSISAASSTATFTMAAKRPVHFDSRVWVGDSIEDVVAYFSWRQADTHRCCLNGWAYWTLREAGVSKRAATSTLKGMTPQKKIELLERHGIMYGRVEPWQKNGMGVEYREVLKNARNPITGASVIAHRRQQVILSELDSGDDYRAMVREIAERSTLGARGKKRQREALING